MKKPKILLMVSIFVVFGVIAGACAPQPSVEEVVVIEEKDNEEAEMVTEEGEADTQSMIFYDDMENKLEFVDYPTSIVSISPSMTEMIFTLGGEDQIVGRDDNSIFPEQALEIASVGSFWGDVPTETILALEPDLILAAEIISPEVVATLQDLGLQVFWQRNPSTFEELYENLREIADLTGNMDKVEALISDLETRVATIEDIVSGAGTIPSVFYELDATDPSSPWTTGAGTFIDYLINNAGGVNAAEAVEGDYVAFSVEELITANPDIILLGDALYGVTPESVGERAGWDVITAVKNDAVYGIDPNLVSVPGPRLVVGLEEMAKLIHPELFD